MPRLIIWKNQEFDRMKQDMDRLMSRLRNDFTVPLIAGERRIPVVKLFETDDALVVKADVPGIDPEDLDVSIVDNSLIIKGEIIHERVTTGDDYRRAERKSGTFIRTLKLPCRIVTDQVEATYEKDVLRIVMPKSKSEEVHRVPIKVT